MRVLLPFSSSFPDFLYNLPDYSVLSLPPFPTCLCMHPPPLLTLQYFLFFRLIPIKYLTMLSFSHSYPTIRTIKLWPSDMILQRLIYRTNEVV